jgi:nitrogen fixation protein NifU and related proteins
MDLYAQNIIENFKHPKNFGKLAKPTLTVSEINFSCGDQQEFDLIIEGDLITDIAFRGQGCAVSFASASLLTEKLKGKRLSELQKLNNDEIVKLLGIELGPTRLKCALLPLIALKKALADHGSLK